MSTLSFSSSIAGETNQLECPVERDELSPYQYALMAEYTRGVFDTEFTEESCYLWTEGGILEMPWLGYGRGSYVQFTRDDGKIKVTSFYPKYTPIIKKLQSYPGQRDYKFDDKYFICSEEEYNSLVTNGFIDGYSEYKDFADDLAKLKSEMKVKLFNMEISYTSA